MGGDPPFFYDQALPYQLAPIHSPSSLRVDSSRLVAPAALDSKRCVATGHLEGTPFNWIDGPWLCGVCDQLGVSVSKGRRVMKWSLGSLTLV